MLFNAESLVALLTVGLTTGLVAGQFADSRGLDFASYVAIGIAGAFISYTALGLAGFGAADVLLSSVINAAFGSIVLLTLYVIIRNSQIGSRVVTDDVQEIHGLTVTPGPGALTISFTTRLPSRPRFEIWRNIANIPRDDMIPQNLVAVWGVTNAPDRTHRRRIDGLPQGTLFWFQITADVEDVAVVGGRPASATFVGKAGTLFRFCKLTIIRLAVPDTGDPNGGATMRFALQVYNGSDSNRQVNGLPSYPGDPLITQQGWDFDDVDNGVLLGPFAVRQLVLNAPDVIVPYILGVHDIGGTFGTACPRTLPDTKSHGSDDEGQFGDGFAAMTLPVTMGTASATMEFGSGKVEVSWGALISVETTVSDPVDALNLVQITPFP